MNIRNQQLIRVYNYTPNKVCLSTRVGKEISFAPCHDGIPVMEYMSWDEIEWLNSRGEIFRSGVLRFSPEDEQEIFEALGNPDYRGAMFTEERIRELLLNPTSDNVETIIAVNSASTIERIRGEMHKLISVGENVSAKMESVVNARASEIRDGKLKTAMSVRKREVPSDSGSKAIEELQAQIKAMQAQLDAGAIKTSATPEAAPKQRASAPAKRKPASGSKSPSKKK